MIVRVTFYAKPEPGGKRQRRIARVEREASDVVQALMYVYTVVQRTKNKELLDSVASVKIEVMDANSQYGTEFVL